MVNGSSGVHESCDDSGKFKPAGYTGAAGPRPQALTVVRLLASLVLAGSLLLPAWSGAATCPRPVHDAASTHLLVVSGLGGETYFRDLFTRWANDFIKIAVSELNIPAGCTVHLHEAHAAGAQASAARSDKQNILAAIDSISVASRAGDLVHLLFIGHGTARGGQARFNIPGPDLTPAELAHSLHKLAGRQQVIVLASSASGPFLRELAAPDRVVITATGSGHEDRHARFAGSLIAAYAATEADTDKNHRVSVREAFEYARLETKKFYQRKNRMQTEHAMLEDGEQGAFAGRLHLQAEQTATALQAATPRMRKLARITRELVERIEALKRDKRGLSSEEFENELETLLLQLALNQRSVREAQP